MTDTNPIQTYRPWLSIAVLGGCLALITVRMVMMGASPQVMGSLPLMIPLVGLFGWYMTNRFKLAADSFDNRYLWKRQVYQRSAITHIEDVRSFRGRTSVVLMVTEPDGRIRPIYVSPPGQGGRAFLTWLRGLPGSENLPPVPAAGN